MYLVVNKLDMIFLICCIKFYQIQVSAHSKTMANAILEQYDTSKVRFSLFCSDWINTVKNIKINLFYLAQCNSFLISCARFRRKIFFCGSRKVALEMPFFSILLRFLLFFLYFRPVAILSSAFHSSHYFRREICRMPSGKPQ